MSDYERIKENVKAVIPAIYEDSVYDADIIEDLIQAADKEIAQWKKAKELVEKQLTKLSIECADIRLSADKEIATKDAELARLREEARNWRSVAERLEREKQLKW